MALTIRELDRADAPRLHGAWTRLAGETPGASVFQTPEWAQAWSETMAAGRQPAILVAEEAGQAVGLLAASRMGRRLELAGAAGVSGDHLGVLCRPEDQARVIPALLAFIEERAGCDGLAFAALDEDGPTLAYLRARAVDRGWAVVERPAEILPCIDLPGSWETFVAGLSANMRYHVRRRRRECDALPGSQLAVAHAADEVSAALEALFELHARRWQQAHQSGNFTDPRKREFLQRFCGQAAARGWVRAYRLELSERPMGVLLAFHWRQTASFFQMGWDPDGPAASPGVVLLAASIAGAIGEGMQRYDFLRGDEEYKRRWTGLSRRQRTFVAAWGAASRAALAAGRLSGGLKERVKGSLGHQNWARLKRLAGVR